MNHCLVLFLALVVALNVNADFKLSDQKVTLPKVQFPVEKYKLKNGLTVLLVEDSSVPLVSYHTWFKVGSRDEQLGVTGAAHMLEHMMFKGAKKYSGKDFDRILHENGITNNAFTSNDFTGFYQNLPSSKLELMMDLDSDRLRSLKLDPNDLTSELQVVGEERRWRVDNNPVGLLRENFMATLFQVHPYKWPVIGWMQDIQSYTSDKLRFFYDQFYVPNNAVLVIVGDLKIPQTKRLIEKYYGPLKSKEIPPKKFPVEPAKTQPVRQELKGKVQAATLMIGFPGVSARDESSYALDVLATVLAGGPFSRLHKLLVQADKSAMYVGASNETGIDPMAFMFWISLKPSVSVAISEKIVEQEILKLQKDLIAQDELVRAKNQIIKDWIDSVRTNDGKAEALAQHEIIFGDFSELFQFLDKISAVSAENVRTVAKTYLNLEKKVTSVLIPQN
jgi:zinc protease